jgi:uncharacterized membrane protein YbhN (UPF0104 family)
VTGRVWAWVRVVGGLAIVALLLWRLGTTPFLNGLRVIDAGSLLAAVAIGALTTAFSAWRWSVVGRSLGIRIPLGRAVADYYQSLFLNAALPGGVLGDVHRAVGNGRESGNVGRGVRAVVLERAAGQITLVAVAATVLLTVPVPTLPQAPFGLVAAVAGLGVLLALVLARLGRRSSETSRWGRAWRTATGDVRRGLFARETAPGVLFSSAVVLAGHVATFVLAARVSGATASLTLLVPLALLALLAMAVPLNIGGWGPREGVTAWAFAATGLGATLGLTVAVVYGLFALVASLPGAIVLLTRWLGRAKLRRAEFPQVTLPRPRLAEHALPTREPAFALSYAAPNRSDRA